ncbi:MAG: acyl CoA:acetate/3-ketoacid CoA transferase [Deltaproteobacteria bacterium]|jgi:propionate CoA-transferase|nr:acyl CoA:acetate/3-ketoacid CoA transferase [Deltaproteobacteria bacterium]
MKVITGKEAVNLIKSGSTVAVGGFVGFGVPEEILAALEEKFLASGTPEKLNLVWCAGIGDRGDRGMNHLGHEGLVARVYAGHIGLAPKLGKLIAEEKVECFIVPQGVITHLLRATAGGKPGVLTHVGLKTYADPRVEGCRANSVTRGEVVELMSIGGKEWLFYKALSLDVAVVRGTTADTRGNITMEKEALFLEQISIASCVKNNGGIVIAQVERLTEHGTLKPQQVKLPGVMVDYVVVADPKNHPQGFFGPEYNPAFSGETRVPLDSLPAMPLNERKICARRAAMELTPGALVNLGIGVSEGVANVAAEEGVAEEITLTIESGTIAGIPAGGLGIGACTNPDSIIDQAYQFDFYDGGGVDIAYLGLAEADMHGNLNVSKFGGRVVGPGGFINISQNAKAVIYCGTFTAGGLKTSVADGKLRIDVEGKSKKFIKQVEQITFSGEYAASVGQKVMFVTERAVFELREEGMVLTEIAPGISLEKDVLAQMEFRPVISGQLREMDGRIFQDRLMGLKLK